MQLYGVLNIIFGNKIVILVLILSWRPVILAVWHHVTGTPKNLKAIVKLFTFAH